MPLDPGWDQQDARISFPCLCAENVELIARQIDGRGKSPGKVGKAEAIVKNDGVPTHHRDIDGNIDGWLTF